MHQRADDCHQHPKLSEMHSAFGALWMTQSFEAKNEKDGSQQVA
jgi:hypothetical protein